VKDDFSRGDSFLDLLQRGVSLLSPRGKARQPGSVGSGSFAFRSDPQTRLGTSHAGQVKGCKYSLTEERELPLTSCPRSPAQTFRLPRASCLGAYFGHA
jgi:hypothetical protein